MRTTLEMTTLTRGAITNNIRRSDLRSSGEIRELEVKTNAKSLSEHGDNV